jgi:UDP-glucose 4-epimerase
MGKILVTGGTGFIGSHTCVELINAGHDVIIMDNLSNSKASVVDRIGQITGKKPIFYQADIRDFDKTVEILQNHTIDAVIHFAGLKAVGESVQKPLEYYENNINGTLVLLNAMRQCGCKNIVFSSSATVYGLDNVAPYTEDMPTSATNPYGYTKVMIEQILHDLCTADSEWSVTALRYFNPIGAHKSGLLGEDPNGIPNNLVPYIAQVAIGKLDHLRVFGNDYDTPDGTGVRDYIHVVDLAKGHVVALDYALKHRGFEPINLGTGNGSSVLDVVQAYKKACGKDIPYEIVERRSGDVATSFANADKALKLLNWSANLTLDDMCLDSWNFTVKNPNGIV